ncbi:hypothetical protein L0657_24230 [Dyadobacter sp. CY345]|uniref:hypothetical protein n=1 Tax=Dyadobacter sp. CY345 TaxID=2909335 RepID=UPI001F3EB037|nr:hypothetical protein [Dyadobacter sp. CY345]MCF2447084.1 hypothetical protein [Dyadobacter sp. CY345]
MQVIYYVIVAREMVWQWYYDKNNGKCFRELLGMDAYRFIESLSKPGDQISVGSDVQLIESGPDQQNR